MDGFLWEPLAMKLKTQEMLRGTFPHDTWVVVFWAWRISKPLIHLT